MEKGLLQGSDDWMKYQSEPGKNERFWCIENFNLMDALSKAEMNELISQAHNVNYRRGETIFFPGEKGSTVFSLLNGHVRLAHQKRTGKKFSFAVLGQGQVFGEAVILGDDNRHWEASALSDITLCMVHRDVFLRFANKNPNFSLGIARLINNRRMEFENKVEDLLFENIFSRLKSTLLRLSDEFGKIEEENVVIPFKLPNQEIANLIGASREMTSANIAYLKRHGILSKRNGMIVLNDIDKLKSLENGQSIN